MAFANVMGMYRSGEVLGDNYKGNDMSEERTEGLLVSQDDGVYFIPDDQLAGFKIADDAAEGVREAVGEAEVSGFQQMKFSPGGAEALPPGS